MSTENYLGIVGRGAFAQNFADKIENIAQQECGMTVHPVAWPGGLEIESFKDQSQISPKNLLLLHVGSGRQLPEVMAYCQKYQVPLVQASTGQDATLPSPLKFPYIEAPNLSLPILKAFYLLECHPGLFDGCRIRIEESHQSTKTSVPGTAVRFAELLGQNPQIIKSLRDPKEQKERFQVPEEYLSGHAIHEIKIQGMGAEISLGTRVLGRDTYIYGVLELLRVKDHLKAQKYFITDLIKEGLI